MRQSINQSIILYLNTVKSSVFTFIIFKREQEKKKKLLFSDYNNLNYMHIYTKKIILIYKIAVWEVSNLYNNLE